MGMLLGGMSPRGKKPVRGWGRWVPAAAQGTAASTGLQEGHGRAPGQRGAPRGWDPEFC